MCPLKDDNDNKKPKKPKSRKKFKIESFIWHIPSFSLPVGVRDAALRPSHHLKGEL